jgi:spore maturation protein CgeB
VHRPVAAERTGPQHPPFRIAFVGSAYSERREILAGLADLGLGIWGPGWERFQNDPVVGPSIRGSAIRPAQWIHLYSAAEVVLNISYGFAGTPEPYGTMANVRVFEALACGACQVVDAKEDILKLFRDGEHLEVFRTPEEARSVVVSLLGNPGKRNRLARSGRHEVLGRHTWKHRVETILESIRTPVKAPARYGARR